MKNSTIPNFFEGIPEDVSIVDKTEMSFDFEDFSNIMTEAVYVLDFQNRCFHYVANHNFFLCGHLPKDAMNLGYKFFRKVIHPEDLLLWGKMHNAILKRLNNTNSINEVDFFSCSFRIKSYLLTGKSSHYLMAYQKVKPKYINEQLRFGICLLSLSVIRTSGNLRLYYKDKVNYETCSIISQKWKKQKIQPLSYRQKAILMWTKQGKSRKEVADILCVSISTIDAEKTLIFEKLDVTSMEQAIIYATNHQLIFNFYPVEMKSVKEEKPQKKQDCNHSLKPDILGRIQNGLDNGQSVNYLAKQEGFSETALRKAIKQGILRKQSNRTAVRTKMIF
jgi:DNA-binding CsgD family transcriptional regulator